MTGPNTPPSAADLSRLIDRVDTLQRKLNARPLSTFDALDDVDVDYPADKDFVSYDAARGKWVNVPGGASSFPVGPVDDGTTTFQIDLTTFAHVLSIIAAADDASAHVYRLHGALTGQAEINDYALAATGEFAALLMQAQSGGNAIFSLQSGPSGASVGIAGIYHSSGPSTLDIIGNQITVGSSGSELGFYDATPVPQASTPSTLPDVITILQDLGLCA